MTHLQVDINQCAREPPGALSEDSSWSPELTLAPPLAGSRLNITFSRKRDSKLLPI